MSTTETFHDDETQFQFGAGARSVQAGANALDAQISQVDDRWAERILWVGSTDIDLRHRSGPLFAGHFPNERIPRRSLVRIMRQKAFAIQEIPAVGFTSEASVSDILPPAAQVEAMASSRLSENAPKLIAYSLMQEYAAVGAALFERFAGNFAYAERLYEVIVPDEVFRRGAPLEPLRRVREGVEFTGPFLDQWRAYFAFQAARRVSAHYESAISLARSEEEQEQLAREREDCEYMLSELRSAIAKSWSHQNTVLNKSEQDIRHKNNGGQGKDWYDMPDARFADAPPPRDLLFLADTNRQPINLKEVQIAQEMGHQQSAAIREGFSQLGQQLSQPAAAASAAGGGVPLDAVEELLERQAAKLRAEFEEREERLRIELMPPEDPGATGDESAGLEIEFGQGDDDD